jgi:uncharacterized protein (DUF302 family)
MGFERPTGISYTLALHNKELIVATRQIQVQRFSVTSSKLFAKVVAVVDAAIGHPDMKAFSTDVAAAKTYPELEEVVRKVLGPSELMEFTRFDLGAILRKEKGEAARNSVRLVGNPLIMKRMVEHVPDAGSYAPVTILIDERADGVHLSYDRMASFLDPYGNEEALKVARDLDSKVESLLAAAAA